jgi:hypothetical protein
VQTNALHLLSYELYLKTPALAAIALFCWLVPIATVYPPGALTVELQTLELAIDFNISVFHNRDPLKDVNNVCSILCGSFDEEELIGFVPLESFYPHGAPINVSDLHGLNCVAAL